MCVKGWKIDRFNPAKIPIITHEMDHEPEFLVEVPRLPRPPLVEPDFIADIPRDGRFSADEPEFLAHLPFAAPIRIDVVEDEHLGSERSVLSSPLRHFAFPR